MKIICIGRNYVEHAKELGNNVPTEPVLFMKPHSAYCSTDKPVYYPEFTNELHYECELVLKICKNGKHIPADDAFSFFNEITVGIDFTARDKQNELKEKGLPWEKAKAFDGSACVGHWIRIAEKSADISFALHVNNEIRQNGNSKDMLFDFAKIIEDASKYFTLNIGDLIFTGTPAGVGECFPGDHLEGFIANRKLLDVTLR
jgi:2-keto-4-pentenoate hydratase/2-oxohepta-3-ene-1,7-dioic acid hydratase in catechol pathway